MIKCKGKNCGSTDGLNHSVECIKDHEDAINGVFNINKIKAEAVREAFEKAEIPTGAKAGCIGEFKFTIENGQVCPECYVEGDDPDCELCRGESVDGLSDLLVDIPWQDQKEIFKAFCKFAAMDAKYKLELGEP